MIIYCQFSTASWTAFLSSRQSSYAQISLKYYLSGTDEIGGNQKAQDLMALSCSPLKYCGPPEIDNWRARPGKGSYFLKTLSVNSDMSTATERFWVRLPAKAWLLSSLSVDVAKDENGWELVLLSMHRLKPLSFFVETDLGRVFGQSHILSNKLNKIVCFYLVRR